VDLVGLALRVVRVVLEDRFVRLTRVIDPTHHRGHFSFGVPMGLGDILEVVVRGQPRCDLLARVIVLDELPLATLELRVASQKLQPDFLEHAAVRVLAKAALDDHAFAGLRVLENSGLVLR